MILLIRDGRGSETLLNVYRVEPVDSPQDARNRVTVTYGREPDGVPAETEVDLNSSRVELLPENR